MDFFINSAFAQGAQEPNLFTSFLPLIIIFALFYFLLIRPQNKRQKEHRQMIDSLKVGQEVVTSGGVLGEVKDVGDLWVTLEIGDKNSIKVQKNTIATLMPKDTIKNA
ncbi:MAG: preprotein translocase subunit YajC [Gammaproteobacteria bacterium TMED78]|nr:MAG: preprotein translocase subunit YajC [Gammaproteobacteria bacterium TMED78]|tara:strand:+ start:2349 stop:2672 length:324 start_codon:yes stop_codon:yes gene_type:complete